MFPPLPAAQTFPLEVFPLFNDVCHTIQTAIDYFGDYFSLGKSEGIPISAGIHSISNFTVSSNFVIIFLYNKNRFNLFLIYDQFEY